MKMIGLKKGQALVELAIILPAFMLLVVILFDFGRAVLDYSILNTAVRQGTRMEVVGGSEADITAKISAICSPLEGFNPDSIGFYSAGTTTDPRIGITIVYNYPPITPGFGKIPLRVQSETSLAPFYR